MESLTDKQQQVLNFITVFMDSHGSPPTLREISSHINTKGTATAIRHLEALEHKGYIKRREGISRSISVVGRGEPAVAVPIAGTVRAGIPTLAVEDIEGYYPVDRMQLRGGTFFLRVKGDSMINDAIKEGDLALIKPQETAENGDIVVALMDDEATLKRFYREKWGQIRLEARNPNYAPIVVAAENVSIIGKAIKIIRDIV